MLFPASFGSYAIAAVEPGEYADASSTSDFGLRPRRHVDDRYPVASVRGAICLIPDAALRRHGVPVRVDENVAKVVCGASPGRHIPTSHSRGRLAALDR